MQNTLALSSNKEKIFSGFFDLLAVAFIYFLPAISHMFSLPIYLLDPMRIVLILSVAHTSKKNAYIIAITLPFFSFLISSHPAVIKSLLISVELILNIWLFFELSKLFNNTFSAALVSIAASKLFYYTVKFVLISAGILSSELISTPIFIQLIMIVVFSGYIFLFNKETKGV